MASVLQVATIKDQGGNNNAIEIANSSANVTINNLAGGTIGSNVTFPAGHVVQTNYYTYSAANANTISSDTPTIFTQSGTSNKQYKATISGLSSGNDVLVQMSFSAYTYRAHQIQGCVFHIFRDSDSTPVYNNVSSGNKRAQFIYIENPTGTADPNETALATTTTLLFMDESPTGSSHTYYLGASTDLTAAIYLYTSSAQHFTSVIQEIQR